MFNCSVEQSIFPDKLKATFFIQFVKGSQNLIGSNYQHISILPLLSKIYKKLMHTRLMDFINKQQDFISQLNISAVPKKVNHFSLQLVKKREKCLCISRLCKSV